MCLLCCAEDVLHKGARSWGSRNLAHTLSQGCVHLGKGHIFIHMRCHLLIKCCGPPSTGLYLFRIVCLKGNSQRKNMEGRKKEERERGREKRRGRTEQIPAVGFTACRSFRGHGCWVRGQ